MRLYFKKWVMNAIPVILGNINKETEYILKNVGVEVPAVLEDASGLYVIELDKQIAFEENRSVNSHCNRNGYGICADKHSS